MTPRARIVLLVLALSVPALQARAGAPAPKKGSEEIDRRLAAADLRLQRGDWEKAAADAREALALAGQEATGASLAPALVRLAVAEAGLGRSDDAVWHWQIALNLDARLSSTDPLAAYGDAGKLLAAHPLRRRDELPAGITVIRNDAPGLQPARRIEGEIPTLSATLAEISAPKWLRLQAVVDEQGRLREPVVVSPLRGMAYEVLEAVRSWRFEPAHKDGRPVATVYDLVVNPPAGKPLTEIAPFQGELAEIEALLRAHHWEEARRRGDDLWSKAVLHGDPSRGYYALMLTLRALAEAGSHQEDEGICRWEAAQVLDPSLYHADLSAYGDPGALLARNRWGRYLVDPEVRRVKTEGPPEERLSRPEIATQTKPEYPLAARRSGVQGTVILSTLIDEHGSVRDPFILANPAKDPKGLDAASLEAICGWHFHPPTFGGHPVPVFYVLTLNYAFRAF